MSVNVLPERMMKRVRLTEETLDGIVEYLLDTLKKPGAVVLVPTETVYGLVARAGDKAAQERIFALKKRSTSKLLGWFTADWRKLDKYGVVLDGLPEKLAGCYCPGALTIIAPCKDGSTQGFRVPDSPLLLKLLSEIDEVLVQTSANASGEPDARSCDEALAQLDGEVDLAVDGGAISGEVRGSTVVDATGKRIKVLRQGAVDLQKWL